MKTERADIFEPPIPVVPRGWDVLPFDQAADVVSDKSKRVKQRDYLPSGKLAVIDQGQDFIGGYTNEEDMAFEGALPVILFGDHTRSIKYVDRPFAVGADGVKILKPAVGFDPKYFFYLLQSLRIPSRGYSRHFQFLRKFHFPRAPEEEQERIVAEIEKQFSRLDEAVANLKRVKANLKRYKVAVLKAAVEGRLVETEAELARREGRSYETGEQLIQRILETRRSQWRGKGKYKEPAAPDTNGLPELPEGWVWATLEQLAFVDVGYAFKSNEFEAEGIRLLRGENIEPGRLRWDDTRYWPKEKLESYRSLLVQDGEIVLAMDRPIVTAGLKLARARQTDTPCLLVQRMARMRCISRETEGYLYVAMQTHRCERHLLGGQTGTQLPHISGSGIASFVVPLPPASERYRIVAEVERHLSIVCEVDAEVDTNLARSQVLRQVALATAFSTGGPGDG